jgi:hypothetical protein
VFFRVAYPTPRDLAYTLQLSHLYLLQSTPTPAVHYPKLIIVFYKAPRYIMELESKTSNSADALSSELKVEALQGTALRSALIQFAGI